MSLSTKVLFYCFSLLLLLSRPRIFQYYFQIYWKKSQYKSFTTRKQQQLGENKKIRLWSTGNSYSSTSLSRCFYLDVTFLPFFLTLLEICQPSMKFSNTLYEIYLILYKIYLYYLFITWGYYKIYYVFLVLFFIYCTQNA